MDFSVDPALGHLRDRAAAMVADWVASFGDGPDGDGPDGAGPDALLSEDSWLIGASRQFAELLGEQGWLGLTWPTEFGGGGRDPIERLVIFETLIALGAPVATSWFADRQIGPTLLQFATPEQCRRWLPGIISGHDAWCIGMSEPDAGSDVASIRTTATKASSQIDSPWIIDGAKVWTSGAVDADWCYLIARTDPDLPAHQGLSEFVIDMHTPGIEVRPLLDMTANAHFCEVRLTGVEVPPENLIGVRGASFKQVMRQMEHERGGIDRLVSNRRIYDSVRSRCDISDPILRDQCARIESGYLIGRLLVLRETIGQAPKGFSALTKTFCTELEREIAEFCCAVTGSGALEWDRVSRAVCYAPAYTIMGGTTDILRNIIAERLLGLPRW